MSLPQCRECGHPSSWHGDRAVVACSVDRSPYLDNEGNLKWARNEACLCPGYFPSTPC